MPKGTITISFETLTQVLRQLVYAPEFAVTGAWVGCDTIDVHIQGDAIGEGFTATAGILDPSIPFTEVATLGSPQNEAPDPVGNESTNEPIASGTPSAEHGEAFGDVGSAEVGTKKLEGEVSPGEGGVKSLAG